jgi:hypothetical protein
LPNEAWIPLNFINNARASLGLPAVSGTLSVEILWHSGTTATFTAGSVTADVAKVSVSGGNGNAVAVLKSGSEILWSWHIWAITSGANVNADYHNPNQPLFMDRLLGKDDDNRGLLYQWGRKDPFPITTVGNHGFGITPVSTPNNVANAVQNPDVFYTGVSPTYDWRGSSVSSMNNSLWRAPDGKKAPSDPCPTGWRVPYYTTVATSPWQNDPSSNWAAFLNVGYRPATSGVYTPAPSNGYVWGAFANGYNATYCGVTVTPSAVNPTATAYRASGYCVRCVKDISRQY